MVNAVFAENQRGTTVSNDNQMCFVRATLSWTAVLTFKRNFSFAKSGGYGKSKKPWTLLCLFEALVLAWICLSNCSKFLSYESTRFCYTNFLQSSGSIYLTFSLKLSWTRSYLLWVQNNQPIGSICLWLCSTIYQLHYVYFIALEVLCYI